MSENAAKVLVLGAGNFGTCLANHLANKGFNVLIWGRSLNLAENINERHRNPKYLSHISLNPTLKAITEFKRETLEHIRYLIIAIPTQSIRHVLRPLHGMLNPSIIPICASKGIENSTLRLPYQIISEELGQYVAQRTAILSGPSFAIEVAEQQPTAVALGCKDPILCSEVQELFHSSFFRVYTTPDPLGLEIAGALKNVIALASGAASGLGFQQNAKAALLTRGLAEITRVGVALGSDPLTFLGLGGVGDLWLTCTSEKSRNFSVGFRLGRGENLDHVLSTIDSIAEGVSTTKAAYSLTSKLKLDAPMIKAVYSVLYGGIMVEDALNELLNREMKAEVT